MSFEDDMKRLETIAAKLRNSDTSLDESIALFEEGVKLTKRLDEQLTKTERKVEILLGDADVDSDSVEIVPFGEAEEAELGKTD
ncbi:MAG: exodeoxyribonuclease VII small subunit [Sphaerochaetaceae bacterium]|jgi:exodeoxyribonuclease VII small subunit